MIKSEAKVLQAVTNLRGNKDFETFAMFLANLKFDETDRLIALNELLAIGRVQGRVSALADIIEFITKAPEALSRIK